MFQTKLTEKIKTHILCPRASPPPPPLENRAVYEIMWENNVQPDWPQMTIWCMRTAYRIPKDTTHSEYVMIIVFPLQQWLHERVSLLRYTYTVCLVCNLKDSMFSANSELNFRTLGIEIPSKRSKDCAACRKTLHVASIYCFNIRTSGR